MDDGYVEEDEDDTWSLSSGNSIRKNHAVRRTPIHKKSVHGGSAPGDSGDGRKGPNNQSPDSTTVNDKMRWLTTDDSAVPSELSTAPQTAAIQMISSTPGQQQQQQQQPINTAKNYIRTIPIPPTPQNLAPQTGGPPPPQQIYMNLPIQQTGAAPGQQRNGFVARQLYYDSGRPVGPGTQVVSIAARDYRMIRRIPGEAYPGDHLRRQGSPLSPHQLQQMQASLQQQAQYATLPGNMQYHPLASQLTVQLPGSGTGGHSSPQASPTPSPQPPNGQQSLQAGLQAGGSHALLTTQSSHQAALQAATSPPPAVQAAVAQIQNQIALQQRALREQQAIIQSAQQQAIQQAQVLQRRLADGGKLSDHEELLDKLKKGQQDTLDRNERLSNRYSVTEEEDPTFGFARRPSVKGIRQRYTSQTELSGLNAGAGAGRPSHVGGGATMGKGPVVAAPPQPPQLPQMMSNSGAQTGVQSSIGGISGQSVQQQIYQNQIAQGYMTLPAGVSLAALNGPGGQMWVPTGEQLQQQLHQMQMGAQIHGGQQVKVMLLPRVLEEPDSSQMTAAKCHTHKQQQPQQQQQQQQQPLLQQQQQQQQQISKQQQQHHHQTTV
ncbi:transcription factor SPT20 homolog [Varroa destructor]|uniref:Uncharacterized protein n=1 Tax=Varroa destructor TaxID=109461 RepID=A0A7M7KH70_VARDE|nr:transcription factor SPT20 homolog [Varroa destructor]